MKIISVYNQKGGTGKTTLSILLSVYLSESGKKVLVLDLDSQESLTHYFTQNEKEEKTIFPVLAGMIPVKDAIQKASENLHFIQGDLRILKIQSSVPFNGIQKLFGKLPYDYLILDHSPSYHNLIVSGLIASQTLIIPSLLSNFDMKSVSFTIEEAKEQNPKAKLFTVFNRQNKFSKEMEKSLKNYPVIESSSTVCTFPNFPTIRKLKFSDKVKAETEKIYYLIEGIV